MRRELSVAMVVGEFPQLSESFILRKAAALANAGHHVTVMARRIGDFSKFGKLPIGVEVHQLPVDSQLTVGRVWTTIREAARGAGAPIEAFDLLRRSRGSNDHSREAALSVYRHLPFLRVRADIIHFEFLGLASLYSLAAPVLRIPWVVSCRGSDMHLLEQRSVETRRMLEGVLSNASAVHCVSDAMAAAVLRVRNTPKEVWVNRPAVDTAELRPSAQVARSGAATKIIAVGRLVWIKGYDYLLAALAKLHREGLAFEAEIVGDGPLRAVLQYSVNELGLAGVVTLVGPLSSVDVIDRMKKSDLFVLSSHNEGISNAVLEAMAVGLPVVTTDAGGMREAVRDGVEGHVVPVRDVPALAAAIQDLAVNEARRREMGRAARDRAVRDFSLERQVANFEAMYRAVIAAAPGEKA